MCTSRPRLLMQTYIFLRKMIGHPCPHRAGANLGGMVGLRRATWLIVMTLSIAACSFNPFVQPGISKAVSFNSLAGWSQDEHAGAWPALSRNCSRLKDRESWRPICRAAQKLPPTPNNDQARAFFETYFVPHRVVGKYGNRKGLFTGYFEPLLQGALTADDRFRYPVYAEPPDLVSVDLGELITELKGRRVRGRLDGKRVVPFYDRSQIDGDSRPLAGEELLWVDDPYDLFFLHIQGSGRVRLNDGRLVGVGYANQNGHPYVAIGRRLIERGILDRGDVNMFSIRDWLLSHPEEATALMNENPSYVFFTLRESPGDGPIGSFQVPLVAQRSVAIDVGTISLGTPLWIETTLPTTGEPDYRRLVFAQDTGGAIRGPVRVDVFFGHGKQARSLAGTMKQQGRVFALLPRLDLKDVPRNALIP